MNYLYISLQIERWKVNKMMNRRNSMTSFSCKMFSCKRLRENIIFNDSMLKSNKMIQIESFYLIFFYFLFSNFVFMIYLSISRPVKRWKVNKMMNRCNASVVIVCINGHIPIVMQFTIFFNVM